MADEILGTVTETTTRTVHYKIDGEVGDLLYNLYQQIWCEACYDADSPESKRFAAKLLPDIQKLNAILKFRS